MAARAVAAVGGVIVGPGGGGTGAGGGAGGVDAMTVCFNDAELGLVSGPPRYCAVIVLVSGAEGAVSVT